MRKILALLFAVFFCLYAEPLKVLAIGNSFTLSLGTYFKDVAKSVPGCELEFENLFVGSCSLEKHVQQYEKSAQNADFRPYRTLDRKYINLQEALALKKWDVITIQQVSGKSWVEDSFHPYADKLIAIVRERCPQAEIIIHQTWSYNAGNSDMLKWGLNQDTMYAGLEKAYRKLAEQYKLRVIPVGLAVQYTRECKPKQLPLYCKDFTSQYTYPQELPGTEDVVGNYFWHKNDKGEWFIYPDSIHLTWYGQYMQACLWCAFLFKRPVEDITFIPARLSDKGKVALMRKCAQRAIDDYRQVGQ